WLTVDESHLTEYREPANVGRIPAGKHIPDMMLEGELAAAILGVDMPKDPRVRTLVPDAQAAAKKWYQREGVIPINHMFVIHQDLARKRPEVVRELFRMIVASRAAAPADITSALPPLGWEANRKGLQMAIDWSYEQKIIPRRLAVEDLMDETTADLR